MHVRVCALSFSLVPFLFPLQWRTADAEIEVPSAENPKPSRVLSFKIGVGHEIVLHASFTARDSPFLISAFSAHSPSFSPNPLQP